MLIYAQMCATEKRRRRKRGQLEDPNRFVVINELVCEGCGDCSVESNCLSVVPKETPFGRKRTIDQDACNKDYSCLNGFCPSFVTVEGGEPRRRRGVDTSDRLAELSAGLPEPDLPAVDPCYDLLVTGVGGTGVVTVGQLVTMAAHLEGMGASVLDFMGFAQKFGQVVSYLRIAEDPAGLNQVRIERASADALLGCDLVVSTSPKASSTLRRGHTRAIVNSAEMPTGDFVRHRDANLRAAERVAAIRDIVGDANLGTIDANAAAARLLGDTIFANVLLLGAAWQSGLVPVSFEALMRAIELNGVAVEANKRAFVWGRVAVARPEPFAALVRGGESRRDAESLDEVVDRRAGFLVGYQDGALAERYRRLVSRVRDAAADLPGGDALADIVARVYFRLLSYKDEYEVARLHTQKAFLDSVREQYGPDARLRFHLAPPLLAHGKDARGRPRKRAFGAWILPLFRVLARMRRLRGTSFDPFGRSAERRMERRLIVEFEAFVDDALGNLSADTVGDISRRAALYLEIRGFGPVKSEAVETVRGQLAPHAIIGE